MWTCKKCGPTKAVPKVETLRHGWTVTRIVCQKCGGQVYRKK